MAEGLAHARALLTRLLTHRFGQIDAQALALIQCVSVADLDAIGERLLTARTLQDALGRRKKRRRALKRR